MLQPKCQGCMHCKSVQKYGNKNALLFCNHPNQEFIQDYFKENKLKKMAGFLGFWSYSTFPIKKSPKWCPILNTKYYVSTVSIHEPNLNGYYDTEPHVYKYEGAERMSNDDFMNLLWECVELDRISEDTTLFVEVRTEYDGNYIDGDDYEVTLNKVVLTDELSPIVDWEKCSPKLPKIYAVDKNKSIMEVNIQ